LEACNADKYLIRYEEGMSQESLVENYKRAIVSRLQSDDWNPDLEALKKYSALESARKLDSTIKSIL